MNNNQIEIKKELIDYYSSQYEDTSTEWRTLGAISKSKNILELCSHLKPLKVIEIGAGDGAILEQLNNSTLGSELYALEISISGIEKINARKLNKLKEVQLFDGYKIPYADKSFDLAICSHVIEHVEHPRLLLREIQRISKYQFFEVPIDFSLTVDRKLNHFLGYGHINIFTPGLFKFLLLSESFKILSEKSNLYSAELHKFLLHQKRKNTSLPPYLKYWILTKTKHTIWKLLPKNLQNIKPEVFAVLCGG